MKWLIYGHNGWIGTQVCELLQKESFYSLYKSGLRVDDTKAIYEELKQ